MSSAALYAWDAAVADYCSFMAARGSNEMSLRPRRSHLGALARLAQLSVTLGAELGDLGAVPAAVTAALDPPRSAVELPERGLEFVGAGPNQWTAAEGALKVRESAHLFTEGLSVEQFLHGQSSPRR